TPAPNPAVICAAEPPVNPAHLCRILPSVPGPRLDIVCAKVSWLCSCSHHTPESPRCNAQIPFSNQDSQTNSTKPQPRFFDISTTEFGSVSESEYPKILILNSRVFTAV